MRQSVKAILLGIFSLVMAAGAQASDAHHSAGASATESTAQPQAINTTGVIKAIDAESKKLTIAHEAIPAVGWPAMTMRFTYSQNDPAISALKVGDSVDFSFVQQGNLSLLQDIKTHSK